MKNFKLFVSIIAVIVFLICLYNFLLENNVFEGEFENVAVGWYFLAKGLFCSLTLYLLVGILAALKKITKSAYFTRGAFILGVA